MLKQWSDLEVFQKFRQVFWSSETAVSPLAAGRHCFTRSKIFLFKGIWNLKRSPELPREDVDFHSSCSPCGIQLIHDFRFKHAKWMQMIHQNIQSKCKIPKLTHTKNAWHKLVQACDQSQSYNSSEGRSLTNILCRTGIVGKLVALIFPRGAKANPKPFLSVIFGDRITWHQKKIFWTNKHGVWNMSQKHNKKTSSIRTQPKNT